MKPFIIYIIIACTFYSCNSSGIKQSAIPVSLEPLDTIQTRPVTVNAKPVLFEAGFIKGTTVNFRKLALYMYGVTIGKLKITSGRIIACDPMHIDEYGIAFTQLFPTGEFPVQLAIAKMDNEEMTAFARISFSEEPVAKWELALQPGQKPITAGSKKIHGYGVDGGVGLFMDAAASKLLDKKTVEDMDGVVFQDMYKHYRVAWKYTMYNFGEHNLAAFSTGLGDGYYGTYIGFDAAGKPCRLLTDFDFIKWK